MSTEANKKLVVAFWHAMAKGDREGMRSTMADKIRYFCAGDMPACAPDTSPDSYVDRMLKVGASNIAGPGKLMLGEMTAEGDRVAVEVESHYPTTNGKLYNNFYHYLFYVKDGKIVGIKEYCDTLHAFDTFAGDDITGTRIPRKSNIWGAPMVMGE